MAVQAARDRASSVLAQLQNVTDRVIPPQKRQETYSRIVKFSQERPLLASFILIQLLIAFIPIQLFNIFVVSTVAVAFMTAVAFTAFWVGTAVFVLLPTLFITVSFGVFVWIWAVSTYLAASWCYKFIYSRQNTQAIKVKTMNNGMTDDLYGS